MFCITRIDSEGTPIYLIPLAYAVVLAFCRNLKRLFLTLSVMTVNSVCLIRYAFYPMAVASDGNLYFSKESIYLMVYELIVVLVFLNFYSSRISNLDGLKTSNIKRNKLGIVNVLLIIVTILFGLIYPSLLSIFLFYGAEAGTASGIVSITFSIGVMIIYSATVSKLSNIKLGGVLPLLLSILFAVFYIFITSFGETNVHRWSFLTVGIPTIYVLVSSFPKYRKNILSFAFIAIPVSIVLGSFVKFALADRSVTAFSNTFLNGRSLDAYFGGLNGITNALFILRGSTNAESFMSTLTDFFGNMPLVSHFFNTDLYSTQILYLDGLGRRDQICPLLAQSVIHFGVIGAPVLSIIMIIIAVESERFSKRAKTVYSLYGSIMLCVFFSLFMCLNTMILFSNAWKLLIFMVLQYINEKYFLDGKAVNNSSRIQYS